jgi:Fe-S cluster assembly protein SufB
VPVTDNKFAALNTAAWSGGSFVYVPKNVKVRMPLQAYFRINTEKAGQFERTLIIADEGAEVTYVEGCTAPIYLSSSLHSAVVEIIAHKNAHVKYVTVQNWSKNVYNLVTQRAIAHENANVEWIDANIGSKTNMKYPSIYLSGKGAKGSVLSVAIAGQGQTQDNGGKIYHLASDTTSQIISKSVSVGNGTATYRGLLHVGEKAAKARSTTKCESLLLDDASKTNTFPSVDVHRDDATLMHEAHTGKVSDDELFYLMSRGLSEDDALTTIVMGFIDPLASVLPLEYSIELKRLVKLNMNGAVG